jgi:hypothetical protein
LFIEALIYKQRKQKIFATGVVCFWPTALILRAEG